MLMFHDTRIELYFTSNYYCNHPYLYKNSLPEDLLPSLHSRQYNIVVNSEDGITVYVCLCMCYSAALHFTYFQALMQLWKPRSDSRVAHKTSIISSDDTNRFSLWKFYRTVVVITFLLTTFKRDAGGDLLQMLDTRKSNKHFSCIKCCFSVHFL